MLPPVVKNLLIINGLFFLAKYAFGAAYNIDLSNLLGLHYFTSPLFRPYQFITYMFMHADIWHIAFNMFALWTFGSAVENTWGPKRFLLYYLITGLGAAIVHFVIIYFRVSAVEASMSPEQISVVYNEGASLIQHGMNYRDTQMGMLNGLINTSTIGASGAVFGLLLAFAMMFPNAELMLIFFPVPIKAKYLVPVYALLELFFGVANFSGDNVAHFAHLGGMLFGFFLIIYWKKKLNNNQFL